MVAPILLIFLRIVTRASCLVQRQKTPDRRPNLSRPYIKLKVYGQTVLLDGGHGRNGRGHGRIAPLIRQCVGTPYERRQNVSQRTETAFDCKRLCRISVKTRSTIAQTPPLSSHLAAAVLSRAAFSGLAISSPHG